MAATPSPSVVARAEELTRLVPEVAHAISKESCYSEASKLKGKVVVITGSGSGFGKRFALTAASHGAKMVLSDLALDSVKAVAEEISAAGGEATYTKCNVTSWQDQVAMFEHAVKVYGAVDVVLPNAGVAEGAAFIDPAISKEPTNPDLLSIEVNVVGVMYTTRLAFTYLQRNAATTGKAIVFLGSMSSFFGIPAGPAYSTSKHAVLGLFRSCYYEAKELGITTSIVCPWFVHTPILGAPARLMIAGLPLATVDGVVNAMIYGSSSSKAQGDALSVDANGVLAIPYNAFLGVASEGDNYYHAFVKRGERVIHLKYTIRDTILAIKRGAGWKILPVLAFIIFLPKLIQWVLEMALGKGNWSSVVYPLAIAHLFLLRNYV